MPKYKAKLKDDFTEDDENCAYKKCNKRREMMDLTKRFSDIGVPLCIKHWVVIDDKIEVAEQKEREKNVKEKEQSKTDATSTGATGKP